MRPYEVKVFSRMMCNVRRSWDGWEGHIYAYWQPKKCPGDSKNAKKLGKVALRKFGFSTVFPILKTNWVQFLMKNPISSWYFIIMKPAIALDIVIEVGNLLGGCNFLTLNQWVHCVLYFWLPTGLGKILSDIKLQCLRKNPTVNIKQQPEDHIGCKAPGPQLV